MAYTNVGPQYLKSKLASKKTRVDLRYRFYDMKYKIPDFGISTPPKLRSVSSVLGWCAKGVDCLADRMIFDGFDNDTMGFMSMYEMNNADVLFDSAILGAMISGCSFIYLSLNQQSGVNMVQMQVIDGSAATGIIDPVTGMLREGYAVLDTDAQGDPILEAYFTAESTTYYEEGEEAYVVQNPAPYPLLVPVVYRPDSKRPFGHSRISRACMDIVQAASRTMKRCEIAAEFYSFPQKYIVGLSDDVEIEDTWKTSMSSMLALYKDEDGGVPSVGQFQQASITPHMDHLRMCAAAFAGETGLTLDDLGFVSSNPTSVESIRASHDTLKLTARKAQRTIGTGFANAGYLAACLRDGYEYQRSQIAAVRPVWAPIFEPDSSMLSMIGDGAIKLNQAIPDFVTSKTLSRMTGIETEEDNG